MNRVMLIGRVVRTPELKTSNGVEYTQNAIAVDDYTSKGEKVVDYFDFALFKTAATNFCKYKNKGDLIYLEGKLKNEKYEDKDGSVKYRTVIKNARVEYLASASSKPNSNNKAEEVCGNWEMEEDTEMREEFNPFDPFNM